MSKWIEKWTQNINEMNQDILVWSSNYNMDDKVGVTWWQRNKSQLLVMLMFGSMTAVFYLIGWVTLGRISGIIFILQVIGNIIKVFYNGIKKVLDKFK